MSAQLKNEPVSVLQREARAAKRRQDKRDKAAKQLEEELEIRGSLAQKQGKFKSDPESTEPNSSNSDSKSNSNSGTNTQSTMQPAPNVTPITSNLASTRIGGKTEIVITREQLKALADSKTITQNTAILFYILMEYGIDDLLNGKPFFEEAEEICKFALAYQLDPDKVGRAILSMKSAMIHWEKMAMPTQLALEFER